MTTTPDPLLQRVADLKAAYLAVDMADRSPEAFKVQCAALSAGNLLFQLGDQLCHRLTQFGLEELVEKWPNHGYRPTIRPDLGPEYEALAEIYDLVQAQRGRDVKAYRG